MCKCLEITDGIRYSALSGRHLQTVERGEGHVEVCPVLAHASGLALLKRGIALGIAKFELHQEPASVRFNDVRSCKGEVVGEEYLVLAIFALLLGPKCAFLCKNVPNCALPTFV